MANAQIEVKGNKVKLPTFLKWGISNIFGHKEVCETGITYVNYIWCKVCAANKNCVLNHPSVKGATRTSAERFINGTSNVTNDAVRKYFFYLRKLNKYFTLFLYSYSTYAEIRRK